MTSKKKHTLGIGIILGAVAIAAIVTPTVIHFVKKDSNRYNNFETSLVELQKNFDLEMQGDNVIVKGISENGVAEIEKSKTLKLPSTIKDSKQNIQYDDQFYNDLKNKFPSTSDQIETIILGANIDLTKLNDESNTNYVRFHFKKVRIIELFDSISSEVPEGYFAGLVNLESINIPTSWNEIPYQLFINCSSLKSIFIPRNINLINNTAFAHCIALEKVIFDESMENLKIDSSAFLNTKSLTSIAFPKGIKNIIPDTLIQYPGRAKNYWIFRESGIKTIYSSKELILIQQLQNFYQKVKELDANVVNGGWLGFEEIGFKDI